MVVWQRPVASPKATTRYKERFKTPADPKISLLLKRLTRTTSEHRFSEACYLIRNTPVEYSIIYNLYHSTRLIHYMLTVRPDRTAISERGRLLSPLEVTSKFVFQNVCVTLKCLNVRVAHARL